MAKSATELRARSTGKYRAKALRFFLASAAATGLVTPLSAYAQSETGASVVPSASQLANASTSSAGGSDIVVTAQRRAERAQDVPISITALSNERLRQQNVTSRRICRRAFL